MKKIFEIILIAFFLISCKNSEQTETKNNSKDENSTSQIALKEKKIERSQKVKTDVFKIEGVYTSKDTISKCNLILEINKENGVYSYKFKTPTRSLIGKISLEINDENDAYYLTLNGIKWSENNGPLDQNGEPIDKNIKLPNGLEGTLEKEEITIQNYGNSMNSYVQLGECDSKYIRLIKQ